MRTSPHRAGDPPAGPGDPPDWLTDDEQRAWRRFLAVQTGLTAALARRLQARSGISLADYQVLVALTDVPDGRLRVLDLARSLDWEQSRMSHHVSRMTRRGLVARAECPDDGRGAFVVLTDEGRASIEDAAPGHVRDVRELFLDALSPAELATIGELSARVLARLGPSAAPPGQNRPDQNRPGQDQPGPPNDSPAHGS